MKKILLLYSTCAILFFQIMIIFSINVFAQPEGWSDDIPLTIDDNEDSRDPSIAVSGNIIHVVWEDQRHYATNVPEIYYKNSSDNGKSWNVEKRLTFWESNKNQPTLVVNGSFLHLVWLDSARVWYMNSSDKGDTWSEPRLISSSGSSCADVDMAINGSNIHVAYSDNSEDGGTDEQLFYVNSTDNGLTWNNPRRLISTIRYTFDLAIDVYQNNVHIVWSDAYNKVGGPGGIFYINSTDNGISWCEEQQLNPPSSAVPDIAVNNTSVHVIYADDETGTFQIHYLRSVDSGISWNGEIKLTNSTDNIGFPSIITYNNEVHVIWRDRRDDSDGEIYYIYSVDNGQNWSDEIRLTFEPAYSGVPDMIMVGGKKDIAWLDFRDGNAEIYYKHYPVPFPPTNLTIDIWDTNLTLNWTAPQNSPSPVDHYLIYRVTDPEAFTFSDSEIIYNSSGTGNDLLTTWNDTTALLDESNNYYYIVRAIDAGGWNDTNTNIVGKYVNPLKAGWNLISLPLEQRNTSISKVLRMVDGEYNVIWVYDAKEYRWRSSTNDLTDINRTMGLWIYMKNKCNLSVVGAVPESTDIALYEGWNLVGYPSLQIRKLNNALSGISWTTVWTYDVFDIDDLWKVNNTSKPTQLNDLEEMRPGCGYWVYVTINDTWVRTRVGEDNKVVVWSVPGLEEKESYNINYESMVKNPVENEKEDSYKVDIAPAKSIDNNEEHGIDFSLIPLVILLVLILVEVKLLYKRKK